MIRSKSWLVKIDKLYCKLTLLLLQQGCDKM